MNEIKSIRTHSQDKNQLTRESVQMVQQAAEARNGDE
jgi:hypothetical protein